MRAKSVLLSFIEQASNSLGTLAITLTMVSTSNATVFGQFSFIFTLVLIAASLQYGLIGTPMLVEVSSLDGHDRADAVDTLFALDCYFRCVAAIFVAIATLAVLWEPGLAALAGAFALLYLWRESVRNALFATAQPWRATVLGIASLLLLLALLFALFATMPATPATALIAASLAIGLVLPVACFDFMKWPGRPMAAYRRYRDRFPLTGWSTVNSAANEAQTRAYVIVVQLLRGSDQLGIIEAGRVLFAPLFLISTAWRRAMQPFLGRAVSGGDIQAARLMTLAGVATVTAIAAVYYGLLYFAYDLLSSKLFGNRFGDITHYVLGWAVYTVLLLANWTLASFLNAMRAYRLNAVITCSGAVATLALLGVLAFAVPLGMVLVILNIVQLGVFFVLLVKLFRATPAMADVQGQQS